MPLNHEQAAARLKKFSDKAWVLRRAGAAVAMPAGILREFGLALFPKPRKLSVGNSYDQLGGMDEFRKRQEEELRFRKRLADHLMRMKAAPRRALFKAIHPALAPVIDAAWDLLDRLPYQTGYARKAFRLPNGGQAITLAKVQWLFDIARVTHKYNQDVRWFAAWCPHLGENYLDYSARGSLGYLFAAAIDAGGETGGEVFEILRRSAEGEHEIGEMGHHVVRAFLTCSDPAGREYMEKLLVAARREEGLRQVILETVDEAHPESFRRMMHLILDENLVRFSAVTRAADVWFGLLWDSASAATVRGAIAQALKFIEDSQARDEAIAGGKAEAAYFALWASAFENAGACIGTASALLTDADPERRFAAAHLLSQLGLAAADRALIDVTDDEDLRVASLPVLRQTTQVSEGDQDLFFERLGANFDRFPVKPAEGRPVLWPWLNQIAARDQVASLMVENLGSHPPRAMIPYADRVGADVRSEIIRRIAGRDRIEGEVRSFLIDATGDKGGAAREYARIGLKRAKVVPTDEESVRLESFLTRKAADLRVGVFDLIMLRKDADVLGSADRLLASGKKTTAEAGVELLTRLISAERSADKARARLAECGEVSGGKATVEARKLERLLDRDHKEPELSDCLGLIDPAKRTKPVRPKPTGVRAVSGPTMNCLRALDDMIHERRGEIVEFGTGESRQSVPLGSIEHLHSCKSGSSRQDWEEMIPLASVWLDWWEGRPEKLRDSDGMQAVRLDYVMEALPWGRGSWATRMNKDWKAAFGKDALPRLRYGHIVRSIVEMIADLDDTPGSAEFVMSCLEEVLASGGRLLEDDSLIYPVSALTDMLRQRSRGMNLDENPEFLRRCWNVAYWMGEGVLAGQKTMSKLAASRRKVLPEVLIPAWHAGLANDHDLIWMLAGSEPERVRSDNYLGWRSYDFGALQQLTGRKKNPLLEKYPAAEELVNRCRDRLLEIELARGESPTAASPAVKSLRSVFGVDLLMRLVEAKGREAYQRGYGWSSDHTRKQIFSHLIRVSFPAPGEDAAAFKAATKKAKLTETQLIELAVFAPQWAGMVERALGWPMFEEAVWWFHAHTKDDQWSVDQDVREVWTAETAERTPLTAADLTEGAVDVQWFRRIGEKLSGERWEKLSAAAKMASSGGGHKRAQLFADAMRDKVTRAELMRRIDEKRNQDSVRALGLLPLAKGKAGNADLLGRYERIHEFIRESRKFGSMRQASEKRAAEIGMDNLARTAGYADPVRLQWAMEAGALADLAAGPIAAEAEGVRVELSIDELGAPEIAVTRGDKPLKSIPPKAMKNAAVKALSERRTGLKKQVSRIRGSLEDAMCRGDEITGAELRELMTHAMLAPMLAGTLLVGAEDAKLTGYPAPKGDALEGLGGDFRKVAPGDRLRVAHPDDLLRSKQWHDWQRDCFVRERIQPFKQLFRELYPLTAAEKKDKFRSMRYAGHQVQPRQALALLGRRGWVHRPEEGIRKTYHSEGLSVWLELQEHFHTPAEVEGITLEAVHFSKKGEWESLDLTTIPARIFSEAMRDLDLVVSVAHRGGVDPEASASTVEMRSALIQETLAVLKIGNVKLEKSHARIKGERAEYTVHLGSAGVHQIPGGALHIVAVHAAHRGRLFLPFADDDPKTAEVLSKILLLARDSEIKDPNLLDQIRRS